MWTNRMDLGASVFLYSFPTLVKLEKQVQYISLRSVMSLEE